MFWHDDGPEKVASLGEIVTPDNSVTPAPPDMALESLPIGNPEYQVRPTMRLLVIEDDPMIESGPPRESWSVDRVRDGDADQYRHAARCPPDQLSEDPNADTPCDN